jgi:rhodanese-related sulfurtransferase
MRRKIIVFVLIFLCAVVVPVRRTTDMYNYRSRRIGAAAAREKMLMNPDAIILDVRSTGEFNVGRIQGAILLPDHLVKERAETVLPNKHALILVYCRSGVRSQNAVYDLISMGYTNVFDFGGILDWPYEIER